MAAGSVTCQRSGWDIEEARRDSRPLVLVLTWLLWIVSMSWKMIQDRCGCLGARQYIYTGAAKGS